MSLQNLPTASLHAADFQQRFAYDDPEQEDLQASIARDGIQIPLIVAPSGDGYTIIDGHRRRQAAAALGLAEIPCDVRDQPADRLQRTAFIANFLRKDPTPIELAVAIAKTAEAGEESLTNIAQTLHRSTDWVKRQVAMMDWPDDVLQAIHHNQLSVAAASNLAQVEDPAYRSYLLENAVQNGATARTTAAWLQAWRASVPAAQALEQPAAPAGPRSQPLIPQAPCFGCGEIHRTDELSHLPLCARCISRLRHPYPPR